MDEREAVDRLKRGEVGALEALVRRYHARARRAAYLIVRDHALAEDVAPGLLRALARNFSSCFSAPREPTTYANRLFRKFLRVVLLRL
jgi:DNA-directed RNA polymerase specialized sigma24 family protein